MKTVEAMESRIQVLRSRTEKENYNIIKKLERKIRKAKAEEK